MTTLNCNNSVIASPTSSSPPPLSSNGGLLCNNSDPEAERSRTTVNCADDYCSETATAAPGELPPSEGAAIIVSPQQCDDNSDAITDSTEPVNTSDRSSLVAMNPSSVVASPLSTETVATVPATAVPASVTASATTTTTTADPPLSATMSVGSDISDDETDKVSTLSTSRNSASNFDELKLNTVSDYTMVGWAGLGSLMGGAGWECELNRLALGSILLLTPSDEKMNVIIIVTYF